MLRRLAKIGDGRIRLRALARNGGHSARLREAGADEISLGDLLNPAVVAQALRNASAVYHICPNVHPEEVRIGRQAIALAEEAGVRRFVFHSVLQPAIQEMPHHWAKKSVEALLADSSLDFTILQPAPYMQNILGQARSIAERGIYSVPYDLATRFSMVDLEDVANVAARVLISDEHNGATYELCAPGLLDQGEIAAALTLALGREVRAETIDRRRWTETAKASLMTNYQVDTLVAMFRYYERFGMAGSSRPLLRLLGRTPSSFAQFAERAFAS